MNIITAEQAREITKKAPPTGFANIIDYIFNEIKRWANLGTNFVEFRPDITAKIYYNDIRNEQVRNYIESLGYSYALDVKIKNNIRYEWITISW